MATRFNFTVRTHETKIVKTCGKRACERKPLTLNVSMDIDGNEIKLGYGYKTWWTSHNEGRYSALPYENYKIHHAIMPKEGDVWEYGKRTFKVGAVSGFVCYTAPLLENGRQVATISFETYYKD